MNKICGLILFCLILILSTIKGCFSQSDDIRLGILGENQCGTFVKPESHSNVVISPNYPEPYPNRLNCVKDLLVPEDTIIRLYFFDFDLEWSRNCWLDRLEIWQWDVEGEGYRLLGTYCGARNPPLFVSSNTMRLVLHSDRHHTRRGFRAYVEFVKIY